MKPLTVDHPDLADAERVIVRVRKRTKTAEWGQWQEATVTSAKDGTVELPKMGKGRWAVQYEVHWPGAARSLGSANVTVK